MTRRDRHLDTRTALDFLDHRLTAAERRAVEDHLARPCADCRERLRELGELTGAMRSDRTPEVPAHLHRRALEAFTPAPAPAATPGWLEQVAGLLFDSARTPIPAAARRSVGGAHRLRFQVGEGTLEVELERRDANACTLRGRLALPDAELYDITVHGGGETCTARADGRGAFAIESLPLAPLTLTVDGPGGRWRVPDIEPAT